VDLAGKVTRLFGFHYVADHGTHVAALAAGKANNKGGLVRGVDWNAQIVSASIMDANSNWLGDNHFASNLVDAVDNYGVHILNHSWGRSQISPTVGSALAYAYKMNRLNVTSAGNQGSGGLTFPASMGHGIVSVGATENDDSRSFASSYGSKLNVTAPGGTNIGGPYDDEDIMSAMIGNDADFMAGTSMASPIVAGIASLLKGYDNDLYNDDIQRIIELSADKVSGMQGQNWTEEYGYGRANAYEALKLLQEPYELHHHSITGGTEHSNTSGWMSFYGLPGYAGGAYNVKRYDVRKTVNFPWMDEPNVWGRGVESLGYSNEHPNYAMGFTDVVSHTNNSAVLRTYVYEIWTTGGAYLGWFPTTPQNVEYAYTVHGIPGEEPIDPLTNQIFGPTHVEENNTGMWWASASGGEPPYSHSWSRSYSSSSGPWTQVGSGGSYSQTVTHDMWLRLTTSDNNCQGMICDTVTDIMKVEVITCANPPCPIPKVVEDVLPEEFALTQNYPNPFNPSTTISYDLPEQADVRMEVYNMLGQRVALLVDGLVQPGSHTAVFDASNLSSGTYLLRMDAQGSSGTRFNRTMGMQLVK